MSVFVFLNIYVMLQLANILRYNLRYIYVYICTIYGITCILREKFILTLNVINLSESSS